MRKQAPKKPEQQPDLDPTEELIDSFLEGAPRAQTWGELRQALELRLEAAETEKDIAVLREQIAALAQEEAITRFVEDSVRITLVRPHGNEFELDEELY